MAMRKTYGVSKRLKRIRDDFFALHKKTREAFESGDHAAFEQRQREFYKYSVRYRRELQIPDERLEGMRVGLAEAEKVNAEINYLEAKMKRLEREREEKRREIDEAILEEEKRGRVKWN
jgi:hypothetical protein